MCECGCTKQRKEIPTMYSKFTLKKVLKKINFNTSISHGKETKVGLTEQPIWNDRQ